MSLGRSGRIVAFALFFLEVGPARAQVEPTCEFDLAAGIVTVTVDGERANLSLNDGNIRMNTEPCGPPGQNSATIFNTDLILVNGGDLDDAVGITGTFAGGETAEPVGASEIEIVLDLGGGTDAVYIEHNSATLTFTAGGIDALNDGDEDVTTGGADTISVEDALNIDARLYAGGALLILLGSDLADTIYGSAQADIIRSGFGNDTLYGMGGNDRLQGGPGNDVCDGGPGDDRFIVEPAADGNEIFIGGSGMDLVDYSKRSVGVEVSIGNGLADDGQPGAELDEVDISVENVNGGAGGDVIVGSAGNNFINGGDGDDEIYGGAGRDEVHAGLGSDIVVGDAGRDNLYGDQGMDSLDGGIGNDNLFGGSGADTITGGAGTDDIFGEASNDIIFNNDGQADNVDCGLGATDDAEVDAFDTLTGCEV